MRAPLLGRNTVRLAYLDEAGTSRQEPALCVAGVLVHGDLQSMEVEERLEEVKKKHIPQADRDNVIFHATDIFHGSGYFDRRKPEWKDEGTRVALLTDLAEIISSMGLPVVAGTYQKDTFGTGVLHFESIPEPKRSEYMFFIHATAAVDCAIWTDRWLERFAPNENAIIIAEDNDYIKKMLKLTIRILRSGSLMEKNGFVERMDQLGLPLKRIIDTPHFTAKEDAPALQLADLVAFLGGRLSKRKAVPQRCGEILLAHIAWITNYGAPRVSVVQSA